MNAQIAGKGKKVIGYGEYMGRNDLINVVVSSEVQRLEHSAFRNCRFVTSIQLPYDLQSIGGYCFAGCIRLKRLYMPGRVMKFDYTAFRQCINLCEVIIMDKLHSSSENDCERRFFRIPRLDEYMRWMYVEAAMCFFESGVGMGQYDSLYPRLDELEDRLHVAIYRLEDPIGIDEGKRYEYEGTLAAAVESIIKSDNVSLLTRVGNLRCIPSRFLDYYIETAVKRSSTCAAYLLKYKSDFHPEVEYNFDL